MNAPLPPGFMRHPAHLLALGFGAGRVPRAPGTAGTLLGVLLYLPCRDLPLVWYAAGVTLMLVAGVWICGRTASDLRVHDHPSIVWDEIAGYAATMIGAPRGWTWVLAGLVLFRVFDIAKPWPIGMLDRTVGGGIGIMLDDVVAALYAIIAMQTIAYLFAR